MKIVFKVAAVAALLAGCAQPSLTGEQMIAQKKGAIIFFVDMNQGEDCDEWATLGQYDASVGGYREFTGRHAILPGTSDSLGRRSEEPRITYLPAGRYGIVRVSCGYSRITSHKYRSRKVHLGLFNEMWPNAIAEFDVKPGEYVNIGQLTAVDTGLLQEPITKRFNSPLEISVVSDIPQQKMQLFKQKHPDFADKIVTRLMKRPPLRQPSGE